MLAMALTAVEFVRVVITIHNAVTTLARWNTVFIATHKFSSSAVYRTARNG